MKIQTMFKSIFGAAFITLLLLMVSCDSSGNPSALVGKWVEVGKNSKGEVMELLSDGTGIVTEGSKGGLAITWKTEKDRFYVTVFGGAEAMNYKLQGSKLTFTEDNGKIYEYVKCKKDCQTTVKEYFKAEAITDSRDSKSYKTIKIDNQTWMAENLNYNADGSKCYGNDEDNCQKYGRLYDWNTAMKACPNGWRLPSKDEWQTLVDFTGGKEAGKNLKASNGWPVNGIDAIGFSALPGGGLMYSRRFSSAGEYGYWWSSEGYNNSSPNASGREMGYNRDYVGFNNFDKDYLLSVRCVKATAEEYAKTELAKTKDSKPTAATNEIPTKSETITDSRESNSAIPGKYPQASERILTDSDLQGISKLNLRIMRNEIFARHGYIFKSDDLKEHFKNQSWYVPQYSDVNSMLTSIEQKNIKFIQSYE